MTTHHLPLDQLRPNPDNPRTLTKEKLTKLVKSLRDFPQMLEIRPLVIESLENPVVLGGNMRLQALRELGVQTVAVVTADHLTPEQRREFIIKDNVGFGDWDWDALANEWDADELADWGLDVPTHVAGGASVNATDNLPELVDTPLTKPGDLWLLGDHRLLCGDATRAADVTYLMDGRLAEFILADPPYFRKVDEEWDEDYEGAEGFLNFLRLALDLWQGLLADRGTTAWWCSPDMAYHVETLLRERFTIFNHLVWTKGGGVGQKHSIERLRRWLPVSERLLIGEKKYGPDQLLSNFTAKTAHIASRHAYAAIITRLIDWRDRAGLSNAEIDACLGTNGMAGHYFGWSQWALPTPAAWEKLRPLFASRGVDIGPHDAQRREFDAQRREFDAQRREFDANVTDVWECPPVRGNDRPDHPTPKPLEIIGKLILAHSRPGDLVADPFLGSGTTLISAEQHGRTCYGLELDPKYCDLIVTRWEEATGRQAASGKNINQNDPTQTETDGGAKKGRRQK